MRAGACVRDFGKVHTAIWSSETFRSMSEDGRTLAMYLLTCPHGTIAGVFRLPDGYACEDLQWTPERVRAAFSETLSKGFANRCETTKWVWICKYFEWNKPENPNQRTAVEKLAEQVPQDCTWRLDFIGVCATHMVAKKKPFRNPYETVPQPGEGEGEGEGDIERESASDKSPAPTCPHVELIDRFVKNLPMLPMPKAELWSGTRAKHMRDRWRWVMTAKSPGGKRYAESREAGLDFFDRFFAYAAKSDFLTGRNGKWPGCTLAWLMEEPNFAKVMEGNFHEDERVAA